MIRGGFVVVGDGGIPPGSFAPLRMEVEPEFARFAATLCAPTRSKDRHARQQEGHDVSCPSNHKMEKADSSLRPERHFISIEGSQRDF